MPGTLLFASRVLLVEGDSDAILLNAVLQKLIEIGEFDQDVNSLAVMAAGGAPDAAAMVRILSESAMGPKLAALFDGDDGGEKRRRALERVDVPVTIKLMSPADTTTEDHLPLAHQLYPQALANYLAKMSPRRNADESPLSAAEFLAEILGRVGDLDVTEKTGLTKGMATWSRIVGSAVGQLDDKPSPVGSRTGVRQSSRCSSDVRADKCVDSAGA